VGIADHVEVAFNPPVRMNDLGVAFGGSVTGKWSRSLEHQRGSNKEDHRDEVCGSGVYFFDAGLRPAVVFFWPALLMTYANVEEAVEAAQDRQKRLQQMAADQGCKI